MVKNCSEILVNATKQKSENTSETLWPLKYFKSINYFVWTTVMINVTFIATYYCPDKAEKKKKRKH